jgi:hypothetical protein
LRIMNTSRSVRRLNPVEYDGIELIATDALPPAPERQG